MQTLFSQLYAQLKDAVYKNNFEEVNRLIKENNININEQINYNSETTTLLILAIKENNFAFVKFLADKDVPLEMSDNNGMEAFDHACSLGNIAIVKYIADKLIAQSKDIHKPHRIFTSLDCAVSSGHLDVIRFLAEKGANIKAIFLTNTGRWSLVGWLIEALSNKANSIWKTTAGKTNPLETEKNIINLVNYLIDISDNLAYAPDALSFALCAHNLELAKRIVPKGVREVNQGIISFLLTEDNFEAIQYLLEISTEKNTIVLNLISEAVSWAKLDFIKIGLSHTSAMPDLSKILKEWLYQISFFSTKRDSHLKLILWIIEYAAVNPDRFMEIFEAAKDSLLSGPHKIDLSGILLLGLTQKQLQFLVDLSFKNVDKAIVDPNILNCYQVKGIDENIDIELGLKPSVTTTTNLPEKIVISPCKLKAFAVQFASGSNFESNRLHAIYEIAKIAKIFIEKAAVISVEEESGNKQKNNQSFLINCSIKELNETIKCIDKNFILQQQRLFAPFKDIVIETAGEKSNLSVQFEPLEPQ